MYRGRRSRVVISKFQVFASHVKLRSIHKRYTELAILEFQDYKVSLNKYVDSSVTITFANGSERRCY